MVEDRACIDKAGHANIKTRASRWTDVVGGLLLLKRWNVAIEYPGKTWATVAIQDDDAAFS